MEPMAGLIDGSRILIVDDNPHMRKLVSTMLSTLGRPGVVEQAGCGECGLAKMASSKFDLAIVDLRMAPVDGLSMVRAVRAREKGNRMPIIMMSGHAEKDVVAAMKLSGADRVLAKPLSLKGFARTVASVQQRLTPKEQSLLLEFPKNLTRY